MAELTITFLGTGTSQGVPLVGCSCAVCESEDPRDKRTRSSIYVQTPEAAWVIDTGTDFRTQCLREKIDRVDAVVFTHSHTDHVMGFDDLRPFCMSDRFLPVYASVETMTDLKRIFAFAFNGENQFPGYLRPEPRLIEGAFQLGETQLTPLQVLHGRAHVNGYLLTRRGVKLAAYLSDCKVVPDAVVESIRGVKVLILDALRQREHPTHMSVPEALQIAERVSPEQTWFTHICHELAHAETDASLPPKVRMAHDGLKISIG
jgi:phosphoribosyl 1,2-cyclic phosphate phosphodiesterase